jgi:hypothetical protein
LVEQNVSSKICFCVCGHESCVLTNRRKKRRTYNTRFGNSLAEV